MDAKTKTWITQLENGDIDNKTILILKHIKENPGIDTDQLRDQLKMAHQSLTACITNLLDCGVVEIKGENNNESATYSRYWYVELPNEIILNQKKRAREKFDKWVKRGLKDFAMYMDEETMNKLSVAVENLNNAIPLVDIKVDEHGQVAMFDHG